MTTAGLASASPLTDPGPQVLLDPKGFESRAVRWGQVWQIGTPHYWVAVTAERTASRSVSSTASTHRLGANLIEEVAACVLGGYGMPYEVGLAAFRSVRDAGLLERESTARQIEDVLRRPLDIAGREVRYRFPAQRASYLSAALGQLLRTRSPATARDLRDWLQTIRGIGPKTSAWIVRNHLASDEVAIIDVHVYRAGIRAGVFDSAWTVAGDYERLEAFFLAWATVGGVRAADLDATIWSESARAARAFTLPYEP